MTVPDRPTRFAADLLDSAAAEGARQSRSAKQQLDHWARVGRAVCMRDTAARRRVEMAMAGELEISALSDSECVVFHAELDTDIIRRGTEISFGAELRRQGMTTVALDDDGRLVRYHPDGSTSFVE
ncbi:MAG: TA system antitoxin ParD family protein [Sporichthyaceae bacterium]